MLLACGADAPPEQLLGRGPRAAPVEKGAQAVEIAAGTQHACARLRDGGVRCWENASAMLKLPPLPAADQIAVGGELSCIRHRGDQIACWGIGGVRKPAIEGDALAMSSFATCAIRWGYAPRCVGESNDGRLGLEGLPPSRQIAIGARHGCALMSDGLVWCWGANDEGQLGRGSIDDQIGKAEPVIGLRGVRQIAGGDSHTCALKVDGSLSCWGGKEPKPKLVEIEHKLVQVDAAQDHTCGVDAAGAVWCSDWMPGRGVDAVAQIAMGGRHRCMLTTSGEVWCYVEGGGPEKIL